MKTKAQSTSVTVTLGTQGVSSLTVDGVSMLLQANAPPTICHAVTIDGAGNRIPELTEPISTTVSGNTVMQVYAWGYVATAYTGGAKLSISVSVTNTSADKTIDHLWIYPLGLNLPYEPTNYNPSACASFNLDAPTSIWWTYGTGALDLVNDDVILPLAVAFWKVTSSSLAKWYVSLDIDSERTVSSNWPPVPRPISPGATDTYTVSLRFGDGNASEQDLAGDIFSTYASTYPRTVTAPVPNMPVAAINMTSAHFVDGVRCPYPTNPRGWWNDPSIDVTTPAGIATFQGYLLGSADSTISEIKRVGARGAILWDLEGQQYDAAYIGDPTQMEAIAPELVGVIDAFVTKFKDAGLSVGFTLRPQVFDLATATQTNVADPESVLYGKMQYAVQRWGATMFYIDSNLDYEGNVNPAAIYESLANAFPGVALFPEWEATRYYAYTIPYNNATNNLFGAPPSALAVYPGAVGLVKVNDPAAASYPDEITAAAYAGNILLFDGWYPHPANDFIKKIYEDMNGNSGS